MNKPVYIENSLLITPEICNIKESCVKGLEFMKKEYPNGFTVKDVYNKKTGYIPITWVCWGYHNLPFTEIDKEMFLEYANIINCCNFYMSHHIENCSYIVNSKFCNDCYNIEVSSELKNCKNSYKVFSSSDSCNLFSCKNIKNSIYGGSSLKVENSYRFYHSKRIYNSSYIINSENISDSSFIGDSLNLHNCFLCENLKNQNNRILCFNNVNEDIPYAILGKAVEEEKFSRIKSMILNFIEEKKEYILEKKSTIQKNNDSILLSWSNVILDKNFWLNFLDLVDDCTLEDFKLMYKFSLCKEILEY